MLYRQGCSQRTKANKTCGSQKNRFKENRRATMDEEKIDQNPIETPADKKTEDESIGGYLFNIFLCMVFPFMMLWYGPKYLFDGNYVKGLVLIAIVVTEFILVLKLQDL
jgi:hypothetical protein